MVLFSGCTKRGADPAPGQILRISQRNEPSHLDPAIASLPDEFAILRAIGEGLLIPGPNGEPEPGAATRFEISPDGLTYTFHLRRDGRWSDGQPVVAGDFIASYRRVLTPGTAAPKANVFFPVKNARAFLTGAVSDFSAVGFRAADAHTLVVTLEQPTLQFPYYVLSGPWLPVPIRTIERHGRAWIRPENFVGNGPFTLAEWLPDQRVVVRRNSQWHGAAGVRLGEIHFLRFDNGESEDRAYRAGQVDVTMAVPFSKVETYARERPAELHRAPLIETRYFSFNTRRPPLDDERVRRALALALDRQQIVESVVRGGQPAAGRFVPVALRDSGATASALADVEHRFDPAAARELLAAAGMEPKNFPRLEVTAWSPSQVPVLEAAQQMWHRELGIEMNVSIREARVHWDALRTGNYDIAYVSAIPDVADIAQMLGDFATGAPDNYPRWSHTAFDEAFRRAARTTNPAERAAGFLGAERHLLESSPLTPVYFNAKNWLMSPRVRGWTEDGLWTRCYQGIWLEK